MIHQVFQIENLAELKEYLAQFSDVERLRSNLFTEFLRYSQYRNAAEWNAAVRLCECLAIVGWGNKEALEAICGTSFNGYPNTYFLNRDSKPRLFDAVWSKKKKGICINSKLSVFHESPDALSVSYTAEEESSTELQDIKLRQQRNWIPKNPIYITRGLANCYDNSRSVIHSMETVLRQKLNRKMRPELYGNAIDRITINCSFSFYDDYHCKTNYIIADESLKLKQKDFYPTLLNMFSEQEIEDNGYYLRNRFSYGPFRSDTGTMRIVIVFEREFSEMSPYRQRQLMSEYFIHAIRCCAKRLRKKIKYDFDFMISDFSSILHEWCESSD